MSAFGRSNDAMRQPVQRRALYTCGCCGIAQTPVNPARRNFLKSNAAETRHIIDEFLRVALSFPQIFFSFSANNQEVFHLEKGTLKQRVIQLLGNQYASKLVTVHEPIR